MTLKNLLILIMLIFSATAFSQTELLINTPINVVAPATGADNKTLLDLKKIKGLNLRIPTKCFGKGELPFLASTDEIRFNCLKEALFDDSSNVIWSLRGSYGSARIIPDLQKLPKPNKEKIFIGYSDMTALHLFLSQEWGWKTIHGSNIYDLTKPEKNPTNFTKIAAIINGKIKQVAVDNLSPLNDIAKSNKPISGKLPGGNLTMVQKLA